ncbi:MAG TPA: family 10 glycosylhydrolase [Acholeplasmataceae bacterium]|nr:family 10 glycosylhydrolase [Acholeplasmataceae bacterium]
MFNKDQIQLFSTYQSNGIEMRGIWHMPNSLARLGYEETTLEGVTKLLDKVKEAGYNTILIETVNAYTVYPSKVTTIRRDFENNYYGEEYQNDYLKCFIGEAHKRGMQVHAWTTTMRAGRFNNTLEESMPKSIKPEWLARGYHNEYGLKGKYGELMWLDACNPEVVDYILRQYEELIKNYDLDGIELDAIRYPVSNLVKTTDREALSDFGHTKLAIDTFKVKYNYQGDFKEEIYRNEKLKNDWIEFRSHLINDIVEKVIKLILKLKPELYISAAVFMNYKNAYTEVCQDWKLWIDKGWLDYVSPMAYSTDDNVVRNSFAETEKYCGDSCFNLHGIATIIEGGDFLSHFSQMNLINKASGLGSILFSIRQFLQDEKTYQMVKTVYNQFPAISPMLPLDEIVGFVEKLLNISIDYNNLDNLRSHLRSGDVRTNNIINSLIKTITIHQNRKSIREKLIKSL